MNTIQKVAPVLLLGTFLLLSLTSVRRLSLTHDEANHYRYGRQILVLDSNRFDDSKMPVSALNALPARISSWLPEGRLRACLSGLFAARFITILFSLLTACVLYRWSRELYGFVPALFTLFLYAFDPNIIAHSQLVTTDIYAAGMILLAIYTLWRFSKQRDWRHLCVFGLTAGLAQLSKYSAVLVYPLSAGLILILDLPALRSMFKNSESRQLAAYLRRAALASAFVILLGILIINAGFLFNRTLTPFGDYQFRSRLLQVVQSRLTFLRPLPVPLPYPYIEGLDWVHYRERTGRGYGAIYLLGHLRRGQGFPGYYLAAYLFKEPIASQIVFLIALIVYLSRWKYRRFPDDELFLLGPLLFFTLFFNLLDRAQIGIRFFLVAFPFIFAFSGRLMSGWRDFRWKKWLAVSALAAYLVISGASYFPHYIPYFNELVTDRRMAYKILADSNLDWGQASWYLDQYCIKHPHALVEPPGPVAGTVVVRANKLVGVTAPPQTYQWLRENFQPADTIAYSYLVYEVREADLARIGASGLR